MNEMPIRSIHDDMSTRHANSGAGLLIPHGVDTIVTKYPNNQINNDNSNLIVEFIVLAYTGMDIYLVDFP